MTNIPLLKPDHLQIVQPLNRDELDGASLHDEIYAMMRQALMAGDFAPGQNFTIRTLAERFGTSLMPVRDALKRLVAEHALMLLPNRSVGVPHMTRQRFQELLQVRLSLETMLTRRAAELIGQDDIAEMETINDRMQAAVGLSDVKQYLAANLHFHFRMYRAADSLIAISIVESLWMQAGPFLHGVFNATGTKHARDHHGEILKALRRRDPPAAAEALSRDLGDAADLILARHNFVLEDGKEPRQ